MDLRKFTLVVLMSGLFCYSFSQSARKEQLFDDSWKFYKGEIKNAEKPAFNDKTWRNVDLPHDWSIENLPGQKAGEVVGPFSKESIGTTATGYTVGGTAWYRKSFTLSPLEKFSRTIISFDGVYMNSEVWVNGKRVGNHPYGYTAFHYDITGFLNAPGKANTIAVKVRNEGKNSRWYSGSGIYRHVWLIQTQSVSIAHDGIAVSTENIEAGNAILKILSTVQNRADKNTPVKLNINIIDAQGKTVFTQESQEKSILPGNSADIAELITVQKPKLWSVDDPNLYTAEVQVIANGVETDKVSVSFGIRTIQFSADKGFLLNGKKVVLRGGCLHHDNAFLGSATIDRAEERRVELMKAYGFNAIRTSHNPPSRQFLDACDRTGVLVMDEAFDMWVRPKNPEDYHLYFNDWWKKDLQSMIHRDRNHPCIILWSIGNEINERADTSGLAIRKKLVAEVHALDLTRPVTEAICNFWDHPGQEWQTTAPAYADLDVGGYNYLHQQYDADHALYPDRIIVGTESFALEAYDNWKQMEKNPWVIGDFVWTAMDYLGETACGNTSYAPQSNIRVGLKPWPWFNAFCGDIDLCGFKKPQMYYKDVVWENSKLEMIVHAPVPEGMVETVSYWGWPDEYQSWNWAGNEGRIMDVRVFSNCQAVRLELNGRIIAEQDVADTSKYIVNFKVPYEPGVLKAIAMINGIEVAQKEIRTTGEPAHIKLTADRRRIRSDRNDLSYVKVEITDKQGNVIPNAEIPVTFEVSGQGEMAGSGNGCPTDMDSFNSKTVKTFRGQSLVILRPLMDKKAGTIRLKASAAGLENSELEVVVED